MVKCGPYKNLLWNYNTNEAHHPRRKKRDEHNPREGIIYGVGGYNKDGHTT